MYYMITLWKCRKNSKRWLTRQWTGKLRSRLRSWGTLCLIACLVFYEVSNSSLSNLFRLESQGNLKKEFLKWPEMFPLAAKPSIAASFVQAVQDRQGLMIACPEEIAYRMGYIDAKQLKELARPMGDNHYRRYLDELAREESSPEAPAAGV